VLVIRPPSPVSETAILLRLPEDIMNRYGYFGTSVGDIKTLCNMLDKKHKNMH
jgi:hypothetical protein